MQGPCTVPSYMLGKKVNISLCVDFHSVCTKEISVAIILWCYILLGTGFEFQHTTKHPDPDLCTVLPPLVTASDSTLKQGMTASF
jgi:hypothetical protein